MTAPVGPFRTLVKPVPGTVDMSVMVDTHDSEYPIALEGCEWWMSKKDVANLIKTLQEALLDAP